MKVIDLITKLDNLRGLRDDLERRVGADDVADHDSDLMDEAANVINEYISDLYYKEVKV